MQKNKYWVGYVIAPLIVLGALCLLFWQAEMFPFGEKYISWCDMSQHYIPLLVDFKEMLAGEDGFFYSFSNGGGMNFYSVFFFFLSSPFSFLCVFVDAGDMMRFGNILTLLKMATAAITAYFYFSHHAQKDKLGIGGPVLLSVAYAFCAYGLIYYQNNSWLDEMYLFPVLLWALEELIYNKRLWPYTICIAIAVVFHYYIGIMMAIFCLLYMLLYLLVDTGAGRTKADKKEVSLLFLLGSGLAAGATAIVWLPCLMGAFDSARLSTNVFDNIESVSWLADLDTTLPTILSGGAALGAILISLFFIKKTRDGFAKRLILLVLMVIPLFIEPINLLWHLGSYMSFPSRYGFMTIFIGLTIAYDALTEPPLVFEKKWWHIPLSIFITLSTIAFVWFLQYDYNRYYESFNTYVGSLWGSEDSLIAFGVVFAVAVVIGVFIYFAYRLGANKLLCLLLALVVVLSQACLDVKSYMLSVDGSSTVYSNLEDLKQGLPSEKDGFYRVKMWQRITYENMDGTLADALSHYTSLTDEDTLYQMKQWGYSSYWMKIASYGGTEFSDAFFGCEYEIIPNSRLTKKINGAIYEGDPVYQNESYSIMKRKFVFPMGVFADMEDITKGYMDRLLFQEAFYEELFPEETETLFVRYEETSDTNTSITYTIYVEGEQILYFDAYGAYSNRLTETTNKTFKVYCNDNTISSSYPAQSNNGILCLGVFKDETVTVKVTFKKSIDFNDFSSFGLSGLKTEVLARITEKAQEAAVNLTQNGSSLEGSVTVTDASKSLLLSLTYDKNFTLYVDGVKQSADSMEDYNGYLALHLPEGEHEIRLSYVSPGFWAGLTISGVAVALAVALFILLKKKVLTYKTWMGKLAYPVIFGITALAGVVIYIFPVIYKLICYISFG